MTGLGLLPTLFLTCLCVQLCFIEIYGSSDSVGFFVEEAALRKIYSIPATIRKWIGTDTFYLPARSKGLLIPGPWCAFQFTKVTTASPRITQVYRTWNGFWLANC